MKSLLSTVFISMMLINGCGYSISLNKPTNEDETIKRLNSVVESFHPTVIENFDKAEKDYLVIDTDTDGEMDPDPAKCICKGTGVIVQGDGHKTPCKYHGSKTEQIEKVVDMHSGKAAVEEIAVATGMCKCKDCTCDDCDCKDCTDENCKCNKVTTPPVVLKETSTTPPIVQKKPENNAQNVQYQLIMFTASWCGPCQQMKSEVMAYYRDKPQYNVSDSLTADIRIVDIDNPIYRDFYNKLRGNQRTIPLIVEIENNVVKSVRAGRLTIPQILSLYKLRK